MGVRGEGVREGGRGGSEGGVGGVGVREGRNAQKCGTHVVCSHPAGRGLGSVVWLIPLNRLTAPNIEAPPPRYRRCFTRSLSYSG